MMKCLVFLPFIFMITGCYYSDQEGITYPDAVSEKQRTVAIQQAFNLWRERYLMEVDENHYYVSYDYNHNTVSEAHGYGMLIMVMAESQFTVETKAVFDGMFDYAKAHPSDRNPSFMAWKQIRQSDGTMEDYRYGEHTGSATDGDMDIAYALLLADQLWGSEGRINYKHEATQIIDALMETVVHQEEWILKLGDWVADDDPNYGKSSRTSDWMPGHLAAFYEVTGDKRWRKVSDKIIEMTASIQSQFSPETGLLPDFVWKQGNAWVPVEPHFLESETDPYYSYNASRVPWRLAAGYFLKSNRKIKQSLDRMNTWIKETTQNDPTMIKAGYTLDGEALVSFSDMNFIAPFAISASLDAENQDWIDLLWEKMTIELGPDEHGNYFSDTVRLLVMLFMEEAGNPSLTVID